MRSVLPCVILLSCVGCSTLHESSGPSVVTAATDVQKQALLDRIKALEGAWTNPDMGDATAAEFSVSSNGSVVREVMFPGVEHEMTNMYSMDGGELLMTHYCAMGNQPHMKASLFADNQIKFTTAGVSNLTSADAAYMGEMTITFIDADHIRQTWQSLVNGKPSEDQTVIDLARKR